MGLGYSLLAWLPGGGFGPKPADSGRFSRISGGGEEEGPGGMTHSSREFGNWQLDPVTDGSQCDGSGTHRDIVTDVSATGTSRQVWHPQGCHDRWGTHSDPPKFPELPESLPPRCPLAP